MNRMFILVGIGGFLGSICRYWSASLFTRVFPSPFPYGTLIVNITGCLLIGIFYGLSEHYRWFNPSLRILLTTGFCGGFTTFSSFAYENVSLLQTSHYLAFALYCVASVLLGLLAVLAGLALVKIVTA